MRSLTSLLLLFAAAGSPWSPPVVAADRSVSQVEVNLYVDRKQNQAAIAGQKSESGYESLVYVVTNRSGDSIELRLDAKDIMAFWKGKAVIRQDTKGRSTNLFAGPDQFAPVFLVVDVTNDGAKSAQVVGGYLDVEESFTDLQPYLVIPQAYDPVCGGGEETPQTSVQLANRGWGGLRNAKIIYSFGEAGSQAGPFTSAVLPQKNFRSDLAASIVDGLRFAGTDVNRLKAERFPCPSTDEVPRCTNKLKQSGVFGGLSNAVFTVKNYVLIRVSGTIQYDWVDAHGALHQRSSPFSVDLPLVEFQTGMQSACFAPGPVERQYKTMKLPLDRQNYRVPLRYRGKLAPKETRRFALSLVADKSSQHMFRVVLQLADGMSVSSPEVDLLYFMPRYPYMN